MSKARSILGCLLADAAWGLATLLLVAVLLTALSYEAPTSLDQLRERHVLLVCASVCLVVAVAVAMGGVREWAQRLREQRLRDKRQGRPL